jgi:hypothetical protein
MVLYLKEPCDFSLREQEVSPLAVILQELWKVCVPRVSVLSVLNSLPECHFELSLSLANVLVITCSVQIYSFVRLHIIDIIC